jgi:hypothetical protein
MLRFRLLEVPKLLAPEGVVINNYNIVDRMRANRERKI